MTEQRDVSALQAAVEQQGLAGWLLYDFRGVNPVARSVLGLTERHVGSRRWFYFLPAQGEPLKIVHAIETDALEGLPGDQRIYRSWRSLHQILQDRLPAGGKVAMEYSPRANNPYVSRVDAGTVELIRTFDVDVVSSGDIAQQFEACLDDEQWASHLAANEVTCAAFAVAVEFIRTEIGASGQVAEAAVRDRIMQHFSDHDMTTYSPPIVARPPHNRLPHYETGTGADTAIRAGDLVLIDLWCKQNRPRAIYSDLSRMFYIGSEVPSPYAETFAVVIAARDAGIAFVRERFATGQPPQGWEVDRVVRQVIDDAGWGDGFLHRTGHSLGTEVHGNGAHLDDLEMHEDRRILPRSLFTIEPGIYLDEFGMRSEVDVFVDEQLQVHVTGGPAQTAIETILI